MQPKVFLFDEPTTDLDSAGRKDFIKIIRGLKEKGKTIVLVEHQYEDYLPLDGQDYNPGKWKDRRITCTSKEQPHTARKKESYRHEQYIAMQEISFGYDQGINILDNIDMTIQATGKSWHWSGR